MKTKLCMCLCVLISAGVLEAAFIVEPYNLTLAGGPSRGNANFSTGTGAASFSSTAGTAVGLTAAKSAYGHSSDLGSYLFSYTPGSNSDNWITPADQYFGNGLYASHVYQAGGQTGYYNVYITWTNSTNVAGNCNISITNENATIVLSNINMNSGGTTAMAQALVPNPKPGTVFYGGNNAWLRIASNILLNADETYTVTQTEMLNASVSMRSAGVMWEFVSVPEPATLGLLSLGGLLLARKR